MLLIYISSSPNFVTIFYPNKSPPKSLGNSSEKNKQERELSKEESQRIALRFAFK